MKAKSKVWIFLTPDMTYAAQAWNAQTRREARSMVRKWLGGETSAS